MTATNWSDRFNKARATLDRTAVHEAGHAVVALVMGCPPSEMIAFCHADGVNVDGAVTKIEPPPNAPQPTGINPVLTPAQKSFYTRFAVCKPAGMVAEEKLCGRPVTVEEAGAVQDMQQLVGMVQLAMGITDKERGLPMCHKIKDMSERILSRPEAWELVGKIATALVSAPEWRPSDLISASEGDFTTFMHLASAQRMRRISPEVMRGIVADAMPVVEKIRKRLDIDAHGEYAP